MVLFDTFFLEIKEFMKSSFIMSLYLDDKREKNINYQTFLFFHHTAGALAEFRMTLPPVSVRRAFSVEVKIK